MIDSLDWARAQDAADPLRVFREHFHFPCPLYFAGHSLGLQPRRAREYVLQELDDWAKHGVEGHFAARTPWVNYHEALTAPTARLVGALPHEVVVMNTLSVNLHLLMVSFYRPTAGRHRILIERGAFPSDQYAVASQARFHGFPDAVVESDEPLEALDESIALALIGTPNYLTGRAADIPALVKRARECGAVLGLDLAHGAGNLLLRLHDDGPDFAAWCNYKYLNAGPGGLGGVFVHEKHHGEALPRFEGWWGHNKEKRFEMSSRFEPIRGAEAWQLSNPPILQLAALRASMELFDQAGMPALRQKGDRLTAFLEHLLQPRAWWKPGWTPGTAEILTGRERGSMLTVRFKRNAAELVRALQERGALVDLRPPDIVRITPAPMYNSFEDVQRLCTLIRGLSTNG